MPGQDKENSSNSFFSYVKARPAGVEPGYGGSPLRSLGAWNLWVHDRIRETVVNLRPGRGGPDSTRDSRGVGAGQTANVVMFVATTPRRVSTIITDGGP